jgi:hypothetical protein
VQPEVARALWQVLEPYHAVTYFAPETRSAVEVLGLRGGWMAYFATRAAPLGPVPAEVVVATFYNFHPDLVRRAIPDAWTRASPSAVLAARLGAVDAALRRLLPETIVSPALAEAAALAREAAEAGEMAGRPLYAAYRALPWPEPPHLVLWQAATLLREHRGDGHVASLLAARLDPCEANVVLAATGRVTGAMQREYRWWSAEDWDAAAQRLQARGWLDDGGALTTAGQAGREAIERATDELALGPWERLGPSRCRWLWDVLRPLSEALVERGGVPIPNPTGVPWPPLVPPV